MLFHSVHGGAECFNRCGIRYPQQLQPPGWGRAGALGQVSEDARTLYEDIP